MDFKRNENFRPFIFSTYNSFFNISLGRSLQIWSILGIFLSVLIYQVVLRNRRGIPFLVYTSDAKTIYYYFGTTLFSSITALLTSIFSRRRFAITCLISTSINLILTVFMLNNINRILGDSSSFGNKCIFSSKFFLDWREPLLADCSDQNSRICISNEQNYSKYMIDECDLVVLNETFDCEEFQSNLLSEGIIDKFVGVCTNPKIFKKQTFSTVSILYLHFIFMLFTIPIGLRILRVIYSIYCIITVGGTGWEYSSAEELLLSPRERFSNENPIIPFRYSLNGKNFLRI
ncbi:hypothetical protein HWI79_1841 [Cryptosporidium felis]|nr:hypothetical protein HWI79_1841 [Cryptosporidium felis]